MQLQIETTAHCQATCVFCPHGRLTRPKGTMAMGLFERIIDDADGIPLIDLITLNGLGEPLLDLRLVDRIRYVRQAMPAIAISLYTNGSLLTVDLAAKLADAGLTELNVSLNGVSSANRLAIMGLDDYHDVVAAIRGAMEVGQGRMRVIVKGLAEKDLMESGDSDRFQQEWGGPVDKGGSAFLHLEGNWAGLTWPMTITPTQACARALGHIMVLWDGRVSLCCFDAEGREVLGDLNTQTIREIYNAGRALEIRTAHAEGRRGEIALCRHCTGI